MRHEVTLPKLGETADDVGVLEWLREVGDGVTEGDPLLRVETDKTEADVDAPVSGRLVERLVQEGDEITTGTTVCVIESHP